MSIDHYFVLGIDPGCNGALACLNPTAGSLEVWDMPTHTLTINGSKRKVVDEYELGRLIRQFVPGYVRLAVIEDVHSMPKQGVASAFTFGRATGVVLGALASLQVPTESVSPMIWKKGLRVSADKDSSRRRASQLFPKHCEYWSDRARHDRAEAALLAYFGVKFFRPIDLSGPGDNVLG